MAADRCALTVYFEGPFWVGLFERWEGESYCVSKLTFGPASHRSGGRSPGTPSGPAGEPGGRWRPSPGRGPRPSRPWPCSERKESWPAGRGPGRNGRWRKRSASASGRKSAGRNAGAIEPRHKRGKGPPPAGLFRWAERGISLRQPKVAGSLVVETGEGLLSWGQKGGGDRPEKRRRSVLKVSMLVMILGLAFRLAVLAGAVYLAILVIRALRKYLRSGPARKEKAEDRRSLGEVLKEQRLRCQMTQEFVAETLGVSRQAVSKWERGEADPSTANLLALGRLYGVPAEELLRAVTGEKNPDTP